jgi:hypothetical protein
LEMAMVRSTPFASIVAEAEAKPAALISLPANPIAARTVVSSNAAGNASIGRCFNAVVSKAMGEARLERSSCPLNRSRARDSRDRIVPWGQPIRNHTSSVVKPSR